MSEKNSITKKEKDWFKIFTIIDLIILIISIVIPYVLVRLNQEINGCNKHAFSGFKSGASFWIWGRALGFTTFIWFLISVFRGFTAKKHAKLFHDMKKARSLHCKTSFITIIFLSLHVLFLISSDPWRSIILGGRVKHFSSNFYILKLWTGIIFGIIMVSVSILFFYLRDLKKLRKFGYKRLLWVHRIMLLFTIVLAIHIFLINTEIWLTFFAGNIRD